MKKHFKAMALITAMGLLVGVPTHSHAAEAPKFTLGEGITTENGRGSEFLSPTGQEAPAVATKSGALDRNLPTQGQIAAKFQSINWGGDANYEVEPSVTAPYAKGKLTPELLDNGLTYLNFIRYVAGLPDVTLDEELNETAQHGATLLAANNILTHYPSKPADMEDAFYQRGYEATTSSNISWCLGYSNVKLDFSINGCMNDLGSSNALQMGHRRWLLNPPLGKVGFGYAENSDGGVYMDTVVFDKSGAAVDYDFIAWPSSGNFPAEAISTKASWSVTLNKHKYQIPTKDELTITVTRESDQRTWTFDETVSSEAGSGRGETQYWLVNTGGYGSDRNAIIFGLGNTTEYEYGNDTYEVAITGLRSASGNEVEIQYDVDIFKVEEVQPDASAPGTAQNGWVSVDGKDYWYENGVKQGTEGRGKEIYDPSSGAWYWLDAVQDGAKAVNKDIYQESFSAYPDREDGTGKWVRYDENGHMVKGWQATAAGTYYFEPVTGAMAKGNVNIDGADYYFNEATGILEQQQTSYPNGWNIIGGVQYWYENGVRQGWNPSDMSYRGKEIYDPGTNAWYWLDNVQQGAKAVSKDVYQESLSAYPDREDGTGKWVRYNENGHMIKGWQVTEAGTYYFEPVTGAMAKGNVTIDGQNYYFDVNTGILQ